MIDPLALHRQFKHLSRPELIGLISDLYHTHARSRQALILRLDTRTRDQLRLIAVLLCCVDRVLLNETFSPQPTATR